MNIGKALPRLPYKTPGGVSTTRPTSICSPDTYYDASVHHRMLQRRQQTEHRWIFDLMAGHATNEEIFIENEEWMLCRDRHPGPEDRFLVVFKDTSLYTIRELHGAHVPMLLNVQNACRRFLQEHCAHDANTPHAWRLYFNYMPSVLQLHLHVSRHTSHCSTRIQPLCCVIRNIQSNPQHYTTALIMTCSNRPTEHARVRHRAASSTCAHTDTTACAHNGCWRDARRRQHHQPKITLNSSRYNHNTQRVNSRTRVRAPRPREQASEYIHTPMFST